MKTLQDLKSFYGPDFTWGYNGEWTTRKHLAVVSCGEREKTLYHWRSCSKDGYTRQGCNMFDGFWDKFADPSVTAYDIFVWKEDSLCFLTHFSRYEMDLWMRFYKLRGKFNTLEEKTAFTTLFYKLFTRKFEGLK